MRPTFSHLIITRFNINFNGLYTTKYGDTVRTDSWLQHRFSLFEQWCFPSIKDQQDQNFTWLVFFDTETPEVFKQKIAALAAGYKNFNPVYIASASQFADTVKGYVKANVTSQYIITSRVDNDDMLHNKFVSHIQNLFAPDTYLIDSPLGYQLTLESGRPVMVTSYNKYGPFISLVEPTENFRSVYNKEHKKWKGQITRIALKEPAWVQIIHEKNVLNKFHSRNNYLVPFNTLAGFGVPGDTIADLQRSDHSGYLFHNMWVPYYKVLNLTKRILHKFYRTVTAKNG